MSDLLLPEFYAETADEFLGYLSPWREDEGRPAWPRGWLFRGQARDWDLFPKSLRSDTSSLAVLTTRLIDPYSERWLAERDALVSFFEIADERGLVLPDDSQKVRDIIESLASSRGDTFVGQGYSEWIENHDLLSLMALAQHYGIPTRLLDWSRSALIAAYFAAEGVIEKIPIIAPDDPMIVWAFYFADLGKHDVVIKDTDPVRIVTAPTASNPNLRAQRGLFSLLGKHTRTNDDGRYEPMDKALDAYASKFAPHSGDSLIARCKMQKIAVPRREALRVLKRLAQVDITPSAIYPGYGRIVDDLKMRVLCSAV